MASELIRQLLDAGVHFGHQTRRWHPKMKPFIFGSRSGIHIIDLVKTEKRLKVAMDFLEEIASKNEVVLFVGTKKQAKELIRETSEKTDSPCVTNRWLGGTLTNFSTIRENLGRLRKLREQKAEGLFARASKKEAKQLQRQLDRLEDNFAGLDRLDRLPGCMFIVDTKREINAVREAKRLKIPIVAICDTNVNPLHIDYPIPGNDDAIRSIRLILGEAQKAILAGRANTPVKPLEQTKEGEEAEQPADDASGSEPVPAGQDTQADTPEKKEKS